MHELSDPVASPRGPLGAQLRSQRKEQQLSVPELGHPRSRGHCARGQDSAASEGKTPGAQGCWEAGPEPALQV